MERFINGENYVHSVRIRQLGKLVDLVSRDPVKRAMREASASIQSSDASKQVESILKEIYAINGGDAALTAADIIRNLTQSRGIAPEQLLRTAELIRQPEVLEVLMKLETGGYINGTAKTALNLSELVKRDPEYLAGALGLIDDCREADIASSMLEGVSDSIVKVGTGFPEREKAFAQMLLGIRVGSESDLSYQLNASSVGSNMEYMMEKFGARNFGKILALTEQYSGEVSARLALALYDYLARKLYRYDGLPRDSRSSGSHLREQEEWREISLEEALDEAVDIIAKPEVGGLLGKMRNGDMGFAMIHLAKIAGQFGDEALKTAVGTAQQYRGSSRYVLGTLAASSDAVGLTKKARIMALPELIGLLNAGDYWAEVSKMGNVANLGEEAAKAAVRLINAYGTFAVLHALERAESEEQVLNVTSLMSPLEIKAAVEYFGRESALTVLSALLDANDSAIRRRIMENITLPELRAALALYSADGGARDSVAKDALHFAINSKNIEEVKELAEIVALPETIEITRANSGVSHAPLSHLLMVLRSVGIDTAKRFAGTVSRFGEIGVFYVAEGLARLGRDQETFVATCDSIDKVIEKDKQTAMLIGRSAAQINNIMGGNYRNFLSYVERRGGRNDVLTVARADPRVKESVAQIKTPTSSNTQMHSLIRFIRYTDANCQLNVKQQPSEDLQAALGNAETALRQHLGKLGISDVEEALRFVPWLQAKDETALKVLRGEQAQKNGQDRSYTLRTAPLDAQALAQEVQNYARVAGVTLPESFLIKPSIDSIKLAAQYVISEIDKIDRNKEVSSQALKEAKPNLDRILQMTNKEGEYVLHVAPSDIKGQMEALQTVPSCLSPGSMYFRYTKGYMANPNTFFATIKGKQGTVGRVTIFTGTAENGKPALALVSNLYTIVPVRGEDVDRVLESYASETGRLFLKYGTLKVEGLTEAYDDRASFDGKNVIIR